MEEGNQQEGEKIFPVSDYIKIINQGLREFRAKIIGEVSEVKAGPTGHMYFSLKDERDGSVINCIIWRSRYTIYGVKLKEGEKIIATGCPSVYPPSGRFSFLAEAIEYAGEGKLKKEYERLRKKLAEQGAFATDRKRPIPEYCQKIGVITSRQGAVLADFLSNLGKYGLKIKMIDSRVEGQTAVADLLSAIKTFKAKNIDVLVIMRGGGSLESMMAFNNETLVREIVNFPVPVIAAIGHHKDVPLAALAADYAVSTPSIAATLLGESWRKALLLLERQERRIFSSYESILENARNLIYQPIEAVREASGIILGKYREAKNELKVSFQNFRNALLNTKTGLGNFWLKISLGFKSILLRIEKQLEYIEKFVSNNDPKKQLMVGYSIAISKGKIVRRIKDVGIGENIDIRVADGIIASQVKNKRSVKSNE